MQVQTKWYQVQPGVTKWYRRESWTPSEAKWDQAKQNYTKWNHLSKLFQLDSIECKWVHVKSNAVSKIEWNQMKPNKGTPSYTNWNEV